MDDSPPQLVVEDLVLTSRDTGRVLLDRVSVVIRPNERVGVIGESGAGKTLLARSLIGLLPPGVIAKAGRIRDMPAPGSGGPRQQGRRLATMVPQLSANALLPSTAALRLVRDVAAWTTGTERRDEWEHATQLLREVGLEREMHRKRPHQLSGGMAMRVAIATAMATNPWFLLLDEPSSGLDPVTRRNLAELLLRIIREQAASLVIATHDLWMVNQLCERVLVLQGGRLVADGHPDVLARENPDGYAGRFFKPLRCGLRVAPGQPITSRDDKPVLEAQNVTVDYVTTSPRRERVRALSDVSFKLFRGDSIGVVGRSGAGKSTLAMVCSGLLAPVRGTVRLSGQPHRQGWWAHHEDNPISMVFQNPFATINPRHTIGQWLTAVLRRAAQRESHPSEKPARSVTELLELVGLAEAVQHARPAALSGGECQRAVISACLASRAEIIVLDEPASMLDPYARDGIIALLQRLRHTRQWSYVVVSHDIAMICELCDSILVLDNGRVVEVGAIEQVVRRPRQDVTKQLVEAFTGRLRDDQVSEPHAEGVRAASSDHTVGHPDAC